MVDKIDKDFVNILNKNKYIKNIYNNPLFYTIFINYVNDLDKTLNENKSKRGRKIKYNDNLYFLECFMYILDTGIALNKTLFKCSYSTLYRKLILWGKHNVFKNVYIMLLNYYIKNKYINYKELHNLLIDATHIKNINGQDFKGANHYDRFFNGSKLSIITTQTKIPIGLAYAGSNKHDVSLVVETINNSFIKLKNCKIAGDKGYNSVDIKNKLKNNYNINLISIPKNKRRTKLQIINKEKKIIKEYKFKKLEKKLINKRYKIENFFATLKLSKKIRFRYDKKIINYIQFCYLGFSKYLSNIYKIKNLTINAKEYNKLKKEL